MSDKRPPSLSMVLVPFVITLLMTITRLLGEHFEWNPALFGEPKGGGDKAPFGISWLIFVFGLWFGIRLQRAGAGPRHRGRALLIAAIAIGVLVGGMAIGRHFDLMWFPDKDNPGEPRGMDVMMGVALAAVIVSFVAWPRAAVTLLVYGVLARLTVVAATWVSLQLEWPTHYTMVGAGFPEPPDDQRFLILSMPHLTFWPGVTVLFGNLLAALGALLAGGGGGGGGKKK